MRKVHDTQRRPGAPDITKIRLGREIEGQHPGEPTHPDPAKAGPRPVGWGRIRIRIPASG